METTSQTNLFMPGAIISNRFEVISTLGAGGVGTVAKVVDRHLDNEICALKILFPHLATDSTQFARFRNEVLVSRRLSHPNIVRVYDFGSAGQGYYYITMQYVEGGSLGARIYSQRYQPLSFEDKIRILYEICQGLSCAHRQGVVHRDLKPDNILLDDLGHVKVSDFGLARSISIDKGFTDTGETVGTPYYMSPEQLRGMRPDPRIDIYSLGILAFELVVGRRPFFHEDYFALARMHLETPIPIIATPESSIPQWFQDWLDKATEKDLDKRFSSADEAGAGLAENMNDPQNLTVRRLPAIFSFYGPKKKVKSKTTKKSLAKVSGITAIVATLILTSIVCVRSIESLQNKFLPILVKLPAGSALHAIVGSDVSSNDLFRAIQSGDRETFNKLLDAGVDPDLLDGSGTPLLAHAIQNSEPDFVKKLIEMGASVELADANGRRPLAHSVVKGDVEIVNALIAARADGNTRDGAADLTMLMLAAKHGHIAVFKRLLSSRTSTSAVDKQGKSVLHHAVESESIAIIRALRKTGVQPNVADQNGNTALILAMQTNNSDIIEEVLSFKNLNVRLSNTAGKSAFDYASSWEKSVLRKRERGIIPRPLESAKNNSSSSETVARKVELRPSRRARVSKENVYGSPGVSVKVQISNTGNEDARGVRVSATFADGTNLVLQGPSSIDVGKTKSYSAKIDKVPEDYATPRVGTTCDNC